MNPPKITTRQEKKAYRQIVEAILGMITDGSLEYGSKLYKEQELGQLLGVSRPTLREALRALEILGIVTVRPRNGIIINHPDYNEGYLPLSYILSFEKTSPHELYGLRKAIQIELAWQAAQKRTLEQVEELQEIVRRTEQGMDVDNEEFSQMDNDFHQQIILCSGNMLAYKMMLTLSSVIQQQLFDIFRTISPERRRLTLLHHREITARIAAQDAAGAQMMMREHLHRTQETLPQKAVSHFAREEG